MLEAENLFKAGVKELLVISQDTSAYGVDVKFRTGFWNGKPVKTHMTQLVGALGELASAVRRLGAPALRLSVSACRPSHSDDGRRQCRAVPGRAAAACAPGRIEAHEASGQR
jgi:tRNA A37 methylthiotransferase MiaB